LAASYCSAQNSRKINGSVMTEDNRPFFSVTVSLLTAKDSTMVAAVVTDSLGKYILNVTEKGDYIIQFSFVGYKKRFLGPFHFSGSTSITIPVQILRSTSVNLTAVSVTAQKSFVENKQDKTVYNIESSINSTGSSALEILTKTSGLQVDNSDNITLRGKNGVKIYINGKEMPLDNKSLISYLRSINSNDVKSIEAVTNPDASYDASGNTGIINIRLKKNQSYDTNGDVSLGYIQGFTPKGNASVNLNYRNQKINVFGSVSGNLGQYKTQFNLHRIQLDTLYDQRSILHNYNNGISTKAGLDYSISDRNLIGVMAAYSHTNNLFSSIANTPIYSNSGAKLEHNVQSIDHAPGNMVYSNFNINYRYADTLKTEINFDANYGNFRRTSDGYLPNYYYSESGSFLYSIVNRNQAPNNIDIYIAKLDIANNLWKGKLTYGVKVSSVHTRNAYNFFDDAQNGQPVKVLNLSSQFQYRENVNAIFINYHRSLSKKWTVAAGLRAEQTISKGELFKADSVGYSTTTTRNYTNLFPNVSISWEASQNHSFSLSYNRRIDRPVYQNLNPFQLKLDEFTYFTGNAFLQPQYTNQITLADRLYKKVNASIFYSVTKDYASQGSDTLKNQIYAQVRNIGTQKIIGFNINASFKITKWWNSYQQFWYNYQLFDVTVDRMKLKTNIPICGINIQQGFDLGNNYSAELSGWLNGPDANGIVWKVQPMGGIDIGAKKMLLKNSLTIKLSATDIFHTEKRYVHSNFGGVIGVGSLLPETQTARISVAWRFGNNQVKGARERQTGSENESDRIKK